MKSYIFTQQTKNLLYLVIADIFSVAISLSISMIVTDIFRPTNLFDKTSKVYVIYITLLIIVILVYYIFGLYNPMIFLRRKVALICNGIALIVVVICISFLSYFFIFLRPGRSTLFIFYIIELLLGYWWRILYPKYLFVEKYNIIFIGDDTVIQEIKDFINKSHKKFYNIIYEVNKVVNNNLKEWYKLIKDKNINLVIYSPHSLIIKYYASMLLELRFHKISVYNASDFYQRLTGKIPIHHLDDFWMLINNKQEVLFPKMNENIKRLFDLLICLAMMPFALLLISFSAMAIKIGSRGPVFFIQERLGKGEKPFKLLKLRTMIADAEKYTGPQWSSENDPRITKVGKILRKLRLDELPQIFNVLKGDMSIIGPRPIRRHFAELLRKEIPHYRLRFLVKPGLTGWAQVNHDYAGSKKGQDEKLQYDVYYLIHQSMLLDLFILLKTLQTIIWGKGK